jgi:hypothetical protein
MSGWIEWKKAKVKPGGPRLDDSCADPERPGRGTLAHRRLYIRSHTSAAPYRPGSRGMVREGCACSSAFVRRRLGRVHCDDPPKGESNYPCCQPPGWIEKTDYSEQDFRSSLQAFTAQRTALLKMLEPLSPEAWSRSASVTSAGTALERTVYSYADWMAEHERPHLKQIRRIADALRPEAYARKKT